LVPLASVTKIKNLKKSQYIGLPDRINNSGKPTLLTKKKAENNLPEKGSWLGKKCGLQKN
jgi:hypothetical protein